MLKGCVREELSLKPVSLKAIITLCTRPLIDGDFSETLMSKFLTDILSIPALILHLESNAPQSVVQLQSMNILQRALKMSETGDWHKEFVKTVSVSKKIKKNR